MFDEIKAALGSSVCDVVIAVSVFDVVLWMDGSGLDSFIPSHAEAQVTEQWTHLRRRSGDHRCPATPAEQTQPSVIVSVIHVPVWNGSSVNAFFYTLSFLIRI